MVRIILCLILTVLYLIITLPVLLWFKIVHKDDRAAKVRVSMPMIQWQFRQYLRLSGIKLEVVGKELIPDKPVLFVANHRSIFDVISTYVVIDAPVSYIAKNSLLKFPLFGDWLKFIGCLSFDRSDLRDGIRMLKDAVNLIESGYPVFVFPEGTRSKNESETPLLPFHEGSFRIATRSGCPIVPIAIHNMADLFEKHFPRLTPVSVRIEFGEPIDPASFSKSEQKHLGEYAAGKIESMLENIPEEN